MLTHRTVDVGGLRMHIAEQGTGPLVLLPIAILAAAYWYLQPQPPTSLRLATCPAGSA